MDGRDPENQEILTDEERVKAGLLPQEEEAKLVKRLVETPTDKLSDEEKRVHRERTDLQRAFATVFGGFKAEIEGEGNESVDERKVLECFNRGYEESFEFCNRVLYTVGGTFGLRLVERYEFPPKHELRKLITPEIVEKVKELKDPEFLVVPFAERLTALAWGVHKFNPVDDDMVNKEVIFPSGAFDPDENLHYYDSRTKEFVPKAKLALSGQACRPIFVDGKNPVYEPFYGLDRDTGWGNYGAKNLPYSFFVELIKQGFSPMCPEDWLMLNARKPYFNLSREMAYCLGAKYAEFDKNPYGRGYIVHDISPVFKNLIENVTEIRAELKSWFFIPDEENSVPVRRVVELY